MSGRVRLGELLVTAYIITREQLEETLALQQKDGRRLGKLLVSRGLVTETQLTQILSQQLAVPWVSLYHIDFSRQLLDLVPRSLAEKHCLVPIFVRRVRGLGETLYVAMDDPTDEIATRAVSEFAGLPVRTMIAPPTDIRSAIRAYYGTSRELPAIVFDPETGTPMSAPPGSAVEAAPVSAARPPVAEVAPELTPPLEAPPASARAGGPPPPPSRVPKSVPPIYESPIPPPVDQPPPPEPLGESDLASLPPSSSPTIEAREISMPAPPRHAPRKMVTLTLLDGTRVNLPARESKPPAGDPVEEGGALTARDLIAALRAVTHGADASEILGDKARWEPLFAALLELLLKKHLIADWEFVEEFKKI
jgi:type IV pilus assembly protein PilB